MLNLLMRRFSRDSSERSREPVMQIEIDFDVYKALTALRQNEDHSYNDVLRDLLQLGSLTNHAKSASEMPPSQSGRMLAGRFLPDGSALRAVYKQQPYMAEISEGRLIYNGEEFQSASAAAREITKTNVNGLTFWEVKRPQDSRWRRLVAVPRAAET